MPRNRPPDYEEVYPTSYESRFADSFQDKEIRRRFVQKVYAILSMQLLLTLAIVAICIFVKDIKQFLVHDFIVLLVSAILAFIFFILLACIRALRTIVPLNFIALTVMTLAFAVLMGALSAKYSTFIVLASMGITGAVVLIITLISASSCCDITGWGMYLCIAGLVLSMFGSLAMIVGLLLGLRIIFLIYSCVAALLFCLYLMYDTQLILGGRKYEISSEEYILAAVLLFVDIIYIYTAILTICGYNN